MTAAYGLKILDDCVSCPLKKGRHFCNLPVSVAKRMNAITSTAIYSKGTLLFLEGQHPRGVFVLCTGKAKVSTSSREGKTIITKIADAGELLGLNAAISTCCNGPSR